MHIRYICCNKCSHIQMNIRLFDCKHNSKHVCNYIKIQRSNIEIDIGHIEIASLSLLNYDPLNSADYPHNPLVCMM